MTLQPAAVAPVDAELWWIVYLRGAFVDREESYAQAVKFDRKVPNPRPDRFVVVRRDGGVVRGLFDRPRVAFDVWAKSEKDAADLASLVIALAMAAPLAGAGVVDVTHLSGPNSVAEPSGQPRRLSLIEATHRATVIDTSE